MLPSLRRRRWLLGGMSLAVLAIILIPVIRRRTTAHVLAPSAVTIAPGIHLLGGLAPAAAYVVETSDGLVLIDAGLDRDARLLKQQMGSLGLDWMQIRAILLTHVHGDHSGGAQYLRNATGAKVYAGQGDAAVLRAAGPREAFFSTFEMPEEIVPVPTTVDVEVSGEKTIDIGDTQVLALATPGHTPGSVCYLLRRHGQTALFSGDVIWSLTSDPVARSIYSRPLGTYAAYLSPRYRGDVTAFVTTLQRLRQLPVPDLLLPGHPRNDPIPMSPHLSQSRWEQLLDSGIEEMQQLRDRYGRDGALFLDGAPKRLLPDLYYLGDIRGTAIYGFVVASRLLLVNAPGANELHAVLADRLRKLGLPAMAPCGVLLTSGEQEAASGLPALLTKDPPELFALPACADSLKSTVPAQTLFHLPDVLAEKGWFQCEASALQGRGAAPSAFRINWAGKWIVLSGPIPIKPGHGATRMLRRDFEHGRVQAPKYLISLTRVREWRPDLWLPAIPVDGQNANLSEGEWDEILDQNVDFFR